VAVWQDLVAETGFTRKVWHGQTLRELRRGASV